MRRKLLSVHIRGKIYQVNHKGQFRKHTVGPEQFSPDWQFLGVSFHHWRKGLDVGFNEIWQDPKIAMGGLLWDSDHGTVRQWGGRYLGKLPRITACFIEEG